MDVIPPKRTLIISSQQKSLHQNFSLQQKLLHQTFSLQQKSWHQKKFLLATKILAPKSLQQKSRQLCYGVIDDVLQEDKYTEKHIIQLDAVIISLNSSVRPVMGSILVAQDFNAPLNAIIVALFAASSLSLLTLSFPAPCDIPDGNIIVGEGSGGPGGGAVAIRGSLSLHLSHAYGYSFIYLIAVFILVGISQM
eukprot:UN00402